MNINVPNKLNDIPLSTFMKYKAYLNANENITDAQANKKAVSVFCNLSMREVDSIKHKDFNELVRIISNTLNEQHKGLIMQWNGLGFIPNLDDISTAEYVDLDDLWREDESTIDKFMAVLYRPITSKVGNRYMIEEYDSKVPHIDKIMNLPMDVVRSAVGFFLTLKLDLLNCTLKYSQAQQATMQPTLK